ETTPRAGRGPDADTAGHEGRQRIVGHGVLVDGDIGETQRFVRFLAGDALPDQAEQEEVVVGAAGHDAVATLLEYFHHRARIGDHAFLVVYESWLHGFPETHRLGGDDVHQRTALVFREHGEVEVLVQHLVLAHGHDEATARTTESLVRGRCHHV